MTSNHHVPVIRFKGFTDAWEQCKLGEHSQILAGGTPKTQIKEYWEPKEIPWMSSGEINKKRLFSTDNQISKLGFENSSARWVKESSVLIALAGQGKTRGTVAINEIPLTTNQSIAAIEPDDKLDSEFLFQNLEKRYEELRLASSGDGSRGGLNKQIISDLKIIAPSVKEQTKIGSFFKQLDNTIALHQRELDLLKEQKKGFLQKMFPKKDEVVPEIRFAGYTDAWEQRKLGKLGNTFTGLTGKTKEDFGHGNAKFVTYVNVFSNSITDLEMTENVEIDDKQNTINYGDIFFTTSSETPEEVGMSSVWLGNEVNVYLNSFCFGYRPTAELNPYYMAFMLRSPSIRKKFMFLAQGISRYNISKTKVMEMEVSVPSLDEQTKIGNFFKQLDDTIALHQCELEKLQEMKKAFLQKMFV
ncbi:MULTISPECIES: restriction endonuclease subunit S [Vagococcus]|uniref:restriction endonuclease subunit S n=1 Tax=Vagococcus TaxID=2737 RepID=UPI000E4A2C4C|nr:MULTISPECIES: restriction endonuclease subunit S [Vagococcus]RHH69552.1 restriction endonuclease subunit S [Vagococcus sp. AM17-17]